MRTAALLTLFLALSPNLTDAVLYYLNNLFSASHPSLGCELDTEGGDCATPPRPTVDAGCELDPSGSTTCRPGS